VTILVGLCAAVTAGALALVLTGHASAAAARGAWSTTRRLAGAARPARPGRDVWLRQAGVGLTPTQFWAVSAGGALAVFGVVTLVSRTPLVGVAPAVAAGALPTVYCGHRRSVRRREWLECWPDALRDVVAAIVAGRSLTQAIGGLGESGPEPLRGVFADFPGLARVFGTGAALEQIKERFADPTSDRIVEVLLVAHERGGAIVRDVLEDLVVATAKDVKVLEEIDTEGLEMRINARAVLVLPWVVLVALTMRDGPFRDFYQSSAGLVVVGAAGALSVLGSWWLGRLGRQPDEPRVFAPPARGVAEDGP
jgi:tight adherence protein B